MSVTTNGLLQSGVPASAILYTNGTEIYTNGVQYNLPHLTSGTNVAGYICWGTHSSLGAFYATPSGAFPVIWTNNSNWYVIRTEESDNGQRCQPFCGTFMQWFGANAFGGTNYVNTPVGALTYTDEPGAGGTDNQIFFQLWAGGNNFAICAWASRVTTEFQAVGDPFVRR